MKISTKLRGSAALIISLVCIFVLAVLYVSVKAGQAGERNQIAQKILEAEITGVAFRIEYGLTGENRPKAQLYALYAALNNILDQAAPLFTEPANQTLSAAIRYNQERKKVIFDSVVAWLEQGGNPELVARLNSQLAVTVQDGVDIATRLADLSREEHSAFHKTLNAIVGVLGFFAILFALISYFVSRRISSSLTALQQEFARIASLDFSFTTTTTTTTTGSKDEIGQLAQSFNAMASKLKESYSGLEEKIRERTKKLGEVTDKLIREEKLAIIGKLAGIMGHEIRNPLGVIRNSIYFLNMKFKESIDEKVKRHMDILETEIVAADKIISDVLEFARTKPPSLVAAEINSVIKAVLSEVNIPKTMKVQTDLGENLPTLTIDIAQIKQVFLNIISNAIEAMPKGGELLVTTSQIDTSISIVFKDTGVGIPKENIDKLFTPLFSTKTKGLGLGLSTCQNIISAHQGTIELESKEGQGTTFIIKLPIVQKVDIGQRIKEKLKN